MADIFISYSKASVDLTRALATELEAKGFSVWWDAGLVPGESFSDVIITELDKAHAAIVIWTKDSVKSQWVRSEARRAQERGVLIPTRAANLNPKEIPLPFDGLHTDLVSNRTAILAALGKLGVVPPPPREGGEPDRLGQLEAAAWNRLPKKRTIVTLEAFLADFSDGPHAKLAQAELALLRKRKSWYSRRVVVIGGGIGAATASLAGAALFVNRTRDAVTTLTYGNLVTSIAFSPNGQFLLVGGSSLVRLINIAVKDPGGGLLYPDSSNSNSLAFLPHGNAAVSGDNFGVIKLFRSSGDSFRTLKGHAGPVNAIAVSPDGRTLISGSSDGTVRLWDVEKQDPVADLRPESVSTLGKVYAAVFVDQRTAVTGSSGDVKLVRWDLNKKSC
jgi:hypothetical protein